MDSLERPIKKITGKLVNVMEDVSHVQKNGKNDFHKYMYATAADVLEKVNDALCKNKICSIANANLISFEHVINAKGNQEHLATVQMNIRLIDSESGEYIDISGLGNGQDSGDKAIMKAETASIKYAYMMAFNICTGDDPEADTNTDRFVAVTSAPTGNRVATMNGKVNHICIQCGAGISEKVSDFSRKRFGAALCMECQKKYNAV